MSGAGSKRSHGGTARPIRTRRDFKAATSVAKGIAPQPGTETVAEKRLQALIHEMEKFDDSDDGDESSGGSSDGYDGPRRRWSDDSGEPDL